MSLPPTAVEKGLVLNTRTGTLYGAAIGFATGLLWQMFAGYENPVPLWRWTIVIGAVLGGLLGFGFVRFAGKGTTEARRATEPDVSAGSADQGGRDRAS